MVIAQQPFCWKWISVTKVSKYGQNEYSRALNASYTFQPLMSFWSLTTPRSPFLWHFPLITWPPVSLTPIISLTPSLSYVPLPFTLSPTHPRQLFPGDQRSYYACATRMQPAFVCTSTIRQVIKENWEQAECLLTYQRVEQLKEMVKPRGRSRPLVRSNFWQ